MNDLLNRILGLDGLKLGDAGVRLGFERPLPGWAWLLILIAAGLLSAWAYRGLVGPRPARVALASLRAALLVALAAILAGPVLLMQSETIERDWAVVLADRSASMTVQDHLTPGAARHTTRDAALADAVAAAAETWSSLAAERNLLWLGFDARAFPLETSGATPTLGAPQGRATALARAFEHALRQTAARPVSGLILLTDGRTSDPPDRELLAQLKSRQIPVFVVPFGSATPLPDFAIARTDHPAAAFANDSIPVSVEIRRTPGNADAQAARLSVTLVDTSSGRVLDEQPVVFPDSADQPARLTLTAVAQTAGSRDWAVRLVSPTPDIATDNDASPIRVDVIDRPVRLVYFDGYPRWEYRYLKNLFVRERSIRASALLLAPERRYLQEGADQLFTLPRTPQEWQPYDVIVIGDVRPEMFSREQLQQIRDHVANDGAGLLFIAGPGPTPNAWRATPLADLLPFTLATDPAAVAAKPVQEWLEPVFMTPAPAAERLGVLRLADDRRGTWPASLTDPGSGWASFRFAQRIPMARLKPAAEPLAYALPLSESATPSAARDPLILTMRFGAGRVVYSATDEIWRWRYARGETLPERFWLPIIRLLARQSLVASGEPALLTADPEDTVVNQPVTLTLRLLDQSLQDSRPRTVQARVTKDADPTRPSAVTRDAAVELRAEAAEGVASSTLTATWIPTEPGRYTVRVTEPTLAALDLSDAINVTAPDDELRDAAADHGLLAELASQTGGAVLTPDRLGELPDLLPNRRLRLLGSPQSETLWDRPLVWVLIVCLVTAEWVGRRLIRMP